MVPRAQKVLVQVELQDLEVVYPMSHCGLPRPCETTDQFGEHLECRLPHSVEANDHADELWDPEVIHPRVECAFLRSGEVSDQWLSILISCESPPGKK